MFLVISQNLNKMAFRNFDSSEIGNRYLQRVIVRGEDGVRVYLVDMDDFASVELSEGRLNRAYSIIRETRDNVKTSEVKDPVVLKRIEEAVLDSMETKYDEVKIIGIL